MENISVGDIRDYIFFTYFPKIKDPTVFWKLELKIDYLETIRELIMVLRWNCTFLDYGLLKAIINKFTNESFEQHFRKYEDKIKCFCKQTSVEEFGHCIHRVPDSDIFDNKLTVKFSQNFILEELVENRRGSLAEHLKLDAHEMNLRGVRPGCVCVSWGILTDCTSDVKLAIQQQDSKEFFADSNISMVSLNGEVLYLQDEILSSSADCTSTTDQLVSTIHYMGDKTGKPFLRYRKL